MKKLKEALIFIISILLLMFLPVLIFLLQKSEGAVVFVSNWNYFKMLFEDKIFLKGAFDTYATLVSVSFLFALILFLARKCILKKRKVFYTVCVALSSVLAIVTLALIYKFNYPYTAVFFVFDFFMSLQVGFFVTFLVWIIEFIMQKLRR